MEMLNDILKRQHPVYIARAPEWRDTERRARGGRDVLQELQTFEYAGIDTLAYRQRWRRARYINFVDDIASMIVGHVMQAESTISFGTLGEVKRAAGQTTPSFAELANYNIDGVGNDASQWSNFWSRELRMAFITGHRWEYVDATSQAAVTQADILNGKRPYIRSFSPLHVPDWEFENNTLLYAVLRLGRMRYDDPNDPRIARTPAYTLLVKEGFDEFGPAYEGGGWWNFNERGEIVQSRDGIPQTGNWALTGGEIPMTPLYYQRDNGTDGENPNALAQTMGDGVSYPFGGGLGAVTLDPSERFISLPSISKSGAFELGQLAVDYMNLTSGQSWDVWDAAKSIKDILGVDEEQYATAIAMMKAGSQYRAWKRGPEGEIPTIQDGAQSVVAPAAFKFVLDQIFTEVRYLANRELGLSADASGASKQASFTKEQSPKLSAMASEAENAMNACIRWLEMRWTGTKNPTGSVTISRKFDIVQVTTNVAQYLELQDAAGIKSPTLTKKGLLMSATELGLMGDDSETSKIESELDDSIKQQADAAAAATAQQTQTSALSKDFQTASARAVDGGALR